MDPSLNAVGFKLGNLLPHKVSWSAIGDSEVLLGVQGVARQSVLIAEALAIMGAHMDSRLRRVARVHLNIQHLKSAHMGDLVLVEAMSMPVNMGKPIQVWEVRLWKIDPPDEDKRVMISSSRVILLVMLLLNMLEDEGDEQYL